MLFRRIILSALLVGALAGCMVSLVRHFALENIILAAETYEVDTGHGHDAAAWEPQAGGQRWISRGTNLAP